MKVKIESDGTPAGTKVFNAETGEEIKGLRSVEWKIEVNSLATAKLEVFVVDITALGELYQRCVPLSEVEQPLAQGSPATAGSAGSGR